VLQLTEGAGALRADGAGRAGLVTLHTARYRLDDFQLTIDDLGAGRGRVILVP
jgi:hypothetical protein